MKRILMPILFSIAAFPIVFENTLHAEVPAVVTVAERNTQSGLEQVAIGGMETDRAMTVFDKTS